MDLQLQSTVLYAASKCKALTVNSKLMSEKRTDSIVDLGLVEDGDTYPSGDADDAHRYGHNLDGATKKEIRQAWLIWVGRH